MNFEKRLTELVALYRLARAQEKVDYEGAAGAISEIAKIFTLHAETLRKIYEVLGSAGEGLEVVVSSTLLGLARSSVEGMPYLLSTWVQNAPFFDDYREVVGEPGKWKVVLWWKVTVEPSGELRHTLEVSRDRARQNCRFLLCPLGVLCSLFRKRPVFHLT